MIEVNQDAWTVDCDVLCITTNCTIKSGENVMGGGIAREAKMRDPDLPYKYAQLIKRFGHHVYFMMAEYQEPGWGIMPYDIPLLMFPTKNEVWEDSDLDVIGTSIVETQALADVYGWTKIALPRPGAGLGGLDWQSEVKPFIEKSGLLDLDDRFIIVDFPKKEA